MLVLIDYLRLSQGRRREARREAGLLIHEHGDGAIDVVHTKLTDPARATSRRELRVTLWYLRHLLRVRGERRRYRRRG